MPSEIDFSAHYQVAGHGGVAWYLRGYATQWTEEKWTLACADPDNHDEYDDHYTDGITAEPEHPECWMHDEPEEIEDRAFVRATMVGDDRVEIVDVDDLIKIEETAFCRDCGQIGCQSNVYE